MLDPFYERPADVVRTVIARGWRGQCLTETVERIAALMCHPRHPQQPVVPAPEPTIRRSKVATILSGGSTASAWLT